MPILWLNGITCKKTQEARDEPYLIVNDETVWGPKSINDGESHTINESISFRSVANIELWEHDRAKSDYIAGTRATLAQRGQGEQRVNLNGNGGKYTLTYEVR